MIAPLLSLLAAAPAAAAAQTPPAFPAAAPALPPDWSALPPLRWRRSPDLAPAMDSFAEGEISAGRCQFPRGRAIRVEVAVLVGAEGASRVVPRAIGCATVEQYASGLVSRLTRGNLEPDGDGGWHVTRVDFTLAAPVPAPAPARPAAPEQPPAP